MLLLHRDHLKGQDMVVLQTLKTNPATPTPDAMLLKILTSQSYLAKERNVGFFSLQLSNEKIGFSFIFDYKNKMDI